MAHIIDLRKKKKEVSVRPDIALRKSDYSAWPAGEMKVYPKPKKKINNNATVINSNSGAMHFPAGPVQFPSQKLSSPKISWQAPSFYYNPQKKYLSMVIISLIVAGGGLLVFQKDVLSAIFLMLTSMMFIIYANKKPSISDITVDDSGVTVADAKYFYRDLKSFWIDYNPGGHKELSLESRKWYLPYIRVSIEDRDPLEIRSLMISFLAEKEHESSIVDLIAKRIGL